MIRALSTPTFLVLAAWSTAAFAQPAPGASPTTAPAETPSPAATVTPIPLAEDEEGDYVAGGAMDPKAPKLSGWVISRYDSQDGKSLPRVNRSTYSMQNARFDLAGKVHSLIKYHLSGEAVVGFTGNGFLRDGSIEVDLANNLPGGDAFRPRVTAGQFKKPIGLESRKDEKDLISLDRSSLAPFVVSRDIYDIGAMLSGQVTILEFDVAVVNGNGGLQGSGTGDETDPHKDVIVNLGTNIDVGDGFKIHAGTTVASGKREDVLHPFASIPEVFYYTRVMLWGEAIVGPLVVQSEYAQGTQTLDIPGKGGTVTGSAGWLLAGYKLKGGRFMPWTRYEYRELSHGDDPEKGAAPKDWYARGSFGFNIELIPNNALVRTQIAGDVGQFNPTAGFDPVTFAPLGYSKDMSFSFATNLQVTFP